MCVGRAPPTQSDLLTPCHTGTCCKTGDVMQHAKLTATDGITQGMNVPTPPEKNTTCQHMVCTICFLVFAFFCNILLPATRNQCLFRQTCCTTTGPGSGNCNAFSNMLGGAVLTPGRSPGRFDAFLQGAFYLLAKCVTMMDMHLLPNCCQYRLIPVFQTSRAKGTRAARTHNASG